MPRCLINCEQRFTEYCIFEAEELERKSKRFRWLSFFPNVLIISY